MKKVNLIKIITPYNKQPLKPIFILSNVDYSQAIQELSFQNEMMKCDISADVTEINYSTDLPFFAVWKNHCSIMYQIEESFYSEIANLTKPTRKFNPQLN